jgi:hypothetical protein
MDTEQVNPGQLAALREAFGLDDGGEPALGREAVLAFEAEHGVVLPEPYRSFVAELSDGSDKGPPDYGLVPLAALPSDWGDDRPRRDLAKPFPLTEAWLWEEDDRSEEELDTLIGSVVDHGTVVLGTDGCGMYWHLVVTGPHRGHIWNITDVGAVPFGAEFGCTTAEPGFAGWVAHWAAGKEWFDADADAD